MTSAARPGALDGLKVIDLSHARAGPTCVRQLADMGADAIQVSGPERGDLGGSDAHNLHRGKRSIAIDLKTDAGYQVFLRLVRDADVLVENFRARVKHRLRIDYDTLREVNPRLVYASLSGFGQTGPYRDRPGYDQIAQGLGGLMSVTGPPGGGPWRAGIAVSDTAAGTFLTQGVLAALLARERSGRGQWVHTSLLEAMISFMDFQAVRWTIDGTAPGQAGNDHPTVFPMGAYRTADGYVNLAAPAGWERLARAIGGEELCRDPRFATGRARRENRAALRAAIEQKLAARTSAEWVEILAAEDVACGPVLAMDEVFADPQVEHLEMTARVEHPDDGPVDLLRLPLTFGETPAAVRGAMPRGGQHTREILAEHGYSAAEIDRLVEARAVATETAPARWSSA